MYDAAPQVAHLVRAVGEPPPSLRHHARRHVDAGGVDARLSEVRGHMAGPAADLDHRSADGMCGHPIQEPGLEGLAVH